MVVLGVFSLSLRLLIVGLLCSFSVFVSAEWFHARMNIVTNMALVEERVLKFESSLAFDAVSACSVEDGDECWKRSPEQRGSFLVSAMSGESVLLRVNSLPSGGYHFQPEILVNDVSYGASLSTVLSKAQQFEIGGLLTAINPERANHPSKSTPKSLSYELEVIYE